MPVPGAPEPLSQQVALAFSSQGALARSDPDLAQREVQQRLAAQVAQAIEQRGALVAEAGTGVGKTFAYLVPLLLSGKRALVSTATKSLQDQLFLRDLPLMCVYGIELLEDNAEECRDNLAELFNAFLGIDATDEWATAARVVLGVNIVRGDALTMTLPDGTPITFAEWGYLGKGKFQRRDFRYDELTQRSAWEAEGSLFADLGADLFAPHETYPTMTVSDLAGQADAA